MAILNGPAPPTPKLVYVLRHQHSVKCLPSSKFESFVRSHANAGQRGTPPFHLHFVHFGISADFFRG